MELAGTVAPLPSVFALTQPRQPFKYQHAGETAGVLRRTGNVNLARRWPAIAGFLLSAVATVPAVLVQDPKLSVACYCVAFFGLEWTVGISWAVPLDIGGDYAGSVSAVMNMLGNFGGAISATVVTYTATYYGWSVPFLMTAGLCLIAAVLWLKIDASRKVFS